MDGKNLGMGNFINTRAIASHQYFLDIPFIHFVVSIIAPF
jgi:hypothetical protein